MNIDVSACTRQIGSSWQNHRSPRVYQIFWCIASKSEPPIRWRTAFARPARLLSSRVRDMSGSYLAGQRPQSAVGRHRHGRNPRLLAPGSMGQVLSDVDCRRLASAFAEREYTVDAVVELLGDQAHRARRTGARWPDRAAGHPDGALAAPAVRTPTHPRSRAARAG